MSTRPCKNIRVTGGKVGLEEERVQAFDEYLKDAAARIEQARNLLLTGDWQRGIFELGCASARILQAVEWLNENVGPRSNAG